MEKEKIGCVGRGWKEEGLGEHGGDGWLSTITLNMTLHHEIITSSQGH